MAPPEPAHPPKKPAHPPKKPGTLFCCKRERQELFIFLAGGKGPGGLPPAVGKGPQPPPVKKRPAEPPAELQGYFFYNVVLLSDFFQGFDSLRRLRFLTVYDSLDTRVDRAKLIRQFLGNIDLDFTFVVMMYLCRQCTVRNRLIAGAKRPKSSAPAQCLVCKTFCFF